jgi:UDP-N-acetylmuramyl pentapeptide synthase
MNENKSKVWWDDQQKIVMVKVVGNIDVNSAKELMATIKEVAEKRPGKALILNDMSGAGRPDSAARKYMMEATQPERIEKMAYFGADLMASVVVPFIMRTRGVKNVKFFGSKEKAIKWLKKGK